MGPTQRSLGFLVEDLDAAVQELRSVGAEVDEQVSGNARERYVHFRAPDGQLYELVERRPSPPTVQGGLRGRAVPVDRATQRLRTSGLLMAASAPARRSDGFARGSAPYPRGC